MLCDIPDDADGSCGILVGVPFGVRTEIGSQILGVEAPAWQGAKVQGYLDIPSFRNAARRDGSAYRM